VPLAAGCGAGKDNETEKERATPYSANADVQDIAVRAVRLVASDSASAQGYLLAVLVNKGSDPDTLTNATVTGGTVQPAGAASSDLTVPANDSVLFGDPDLGDTGPALAISGLTEPLQLGTTMHVTLVFSTSGTATLDVPVLSSDDVGTTSTAAPIVTTGGYPTPSGISEP
jgi:copper(I)-binding protein